MQGCYLQSSGNVNFILTCCLIVYSTKKWETHYKHGKTIYQPSGASGKFPIKGLNLELHLCGNLKMLAEEDSCGYYKASLTSQVCLTKFQTKIIFVCNPLFWQNHIGIVWL